MSRHPGNSGITFRQAYQCCGNPCSISTGLPSPTSATWKFRPPASTMWCVTPSTIGIGVVVITVTPLQCVCGEEGGHGRNVPSVLPQRPAATEGRTNAQLTTVLPQALVANRRDGLPMYPSVI